MDDGSRHTCAFSALCLTTWQGIPLTGSRFCAEDAHLYGCGSIASTRDIAQNRLLTPAKCTLRLVSSGQSLGQTCLAGVPLPQLDAALGMGAAADQGKI